MRAWAIFDKQKQYIIDSFIGTADACWDYIERQSYNCGKIASLELSAIERSIELKADGWKCVNGMWISPKSKKYKQF